MTDDRKPGRLGGNLGLAVMIAGILAGIWLADWRWVATGALLGLLTATVGVYLNGPRGAS